jgi:hypothetical protein
MKALVTILALWYSVFVAGCSTVTITYDYDPDADFTGLKTFDWLPVDAESQFDDLAARRIKAAVNRELAAKGYEIVSEKPDFLLTMYLGKAAQREIVDWGYSRDRYGPRYGAYGGRRVDVYEYEEGTLTLDILESADKQVLWRGQATAVIDPYASPEERTKRINDAIAQLLAGFPPD